MLMFKRIINNDELELLKKLAREIAIEKGISIREAIKIIKDEIDKNIYNS